MLCRAVSQSIQQLDQFASEREPRDHLVTLLYAAVTLGIVARLVQYLWRRSYWHDEAYLVLNVTSLSYRRLVGPLPNAQSAPPGFLVAEKALFDAFSSSEYVLRFIPLVLGLAAVVLMAVVARRELGRLGAVCAVALFALSDRLIAHAAEAKQYSGDVFFTLALLLAAVDARQSTRRRLLTASVLAALALWFSHPVIFVFGGIGLALLPSFLRKDGLTRGALMFALCCLPAMASFAALYLLSIRHQEVGDLYAYWADRFPDWSRPWLLPLWLVKHLIGLCRYPYEIGGEVVFALACCGGWGLWHHCRRQLLGLLLAPVGLTLLASLVGRYPFGGSRVTLFLAPAMFLLAGHGIEWLWSRIAEAKWRAVGIAVPFILLGIGIAQVAFHLVLPRHRGHIRPAVEFMRAHRQPDEPIYVIGEGSALLCYWRDPGLLRALEPANAPNIRDERFWVVSAISNTRNRRKVEAAITQMSEQLGPPRRMLAYRGGAAYQFIVPRAAPNTRDRTATPTVATNPTSPATQP